MDNNTETNKISRSNFSKKDNCSVDVKGLNHMKGYTSFRNGSLKKKEPEGKVKKQQFEGKKVLACEKTTLPTIAPETKQQTTKNGSLSKIETAARMQGASLNEVQVVLIETLRKIRRKGDSYGVFSRPVNPIEDDCADYFNIVKREDAMDLGTMESLIRSGSIRDMENFEARFNQIIDCALLYNKGDDNFVRKEAHTLGKGAKPLMDICRRRIERLYGASASNNLSEAATNGNFSEENGINRNGMESSKVNDAKKNRIISNTKELSSLPYSYTSRNSDIPGAKVPSCRRDLDGSEIVQCNDYNEWLPKVDEMVHVCNEAARRRVLHVNRNASHYDKPVSESYIRERLELDDPVRGFVVQTIKDNKLQGFIVFTNFTVWKRTFRWDSLTPNAGITPFDKISHICDDQNGSLAKELQNVKREGDPTDKGIIFHRVAEICLLGGLGCGNLLVRKTLDELSKLEKFDYVVLQATKMAIPFYERMGFTRIGAVFRFEDDTDLPEVPYRHWSDIVGGETVEASYMMARHVPPKDECMNFPVVSLKQSKQKKLTKKQIDGVKDYCLNSAQSILRSVVDLNTNLSGSKLTFDELVSVSIDLLSCVDELAAAKNLGKVTAKKKTTNESNIDIVKKVLLSFCKDKQVHLPKVDPVHNANQIKNQKISPKLDLKEGMEEINVCIRLNGALLERGPITGIIETKAIQINSKIHVEKALWNIHKLISSMSRKKRKYGLISCGDRIMIEKGFGWEEVIVDRKCRSSEIPFGGNTQNSHVLQFHDKRVEARIVDPFNSDRGIGRKWCTMSDWTLFPFLPNKVIDAFVNGSKVTYTNEDGRRFEGTIIGRLRENLKWTIRFDADDVEDVVLNAAELRHIVRIPTKVFHRVKICLETHYPKKELNKTSMEDAIKIERNSGINNETQQYKESEKMNKEQKDEVIENFSQEIRDDKKLPNLSKTTTEEPSISTECNAVTSKKKAEISLNDVDNNKDNNRPLQMRYNVSAQYSNRLGFSNASHVAKRQKTQAVMKKVVGNATSILEKRGYRGVYRTSAGEWHAKINLNNTLFHLGTFSTQEEASKNYYDTLLLLRGHVRRGLL